MLAQRNTIYNGLMDGILDGMRTKRKKQWYVFISYYCTCSNTQYKELHSLFFSHPTNSEYWIQMRHWFDLKLLVMSSMNSFPKSFYFVLSAGYVSVQSTYLVFCLCVTRGAWSLVLNTWYRTMINERSHVPS